MKHVLVVDDSRLNLKIAEAALAGYYKVTTLSSGTEALDFLSSTKTDLILLDLIMPEMDGMETIKHIKNSETLSSIPVIFLTAETNADIEAECLRLGAMDFISKPILQPSMLARIDRTLELFELRNHLELEVQKKSNQVEKVVLQVITAIAQIVDAKDRFTIGHSLRVADLCKEMAVRLDWPMEEIKNLYFAALLHDIGKINVSESILGKSGRLTSDEYALVKTHTDVGAAILKDLSMVNDAALAAQFHHERYDGKGNTTKLSGEQIPLCARIISICDAYESMSSHRAYRNRFSKEYICKELVSQKGAQFDPDLVDIMLDMIKDDAHFDKGNIVPQEFDTADESGFLIHKVLLEYTKEMQNVARVDSLTGVWNRKYAEDEISRCLRDFSPRGTIFLFDIDDFKHINDNYGHITGDSILIKFSNILSAHTLSEDTVCRIGGDEFIIFFKNITTRKDASQKASEILQDLKNNMIIDDSLEPLSSSIGIAIAPFDGTDYLTLYQNADKALYFVKNKKKNSFHFFREETPS